jgi:hypothetical protein
MAPILRFGKQMLVSQVIFIGPQVFKTKVENDLDIAACPLNVWKSHNLLNWLRKTQARGGHWPASCELHHDNKLSQHT